MKNTIKLLKKYIVELCWRRKSELSICNINSSSSIVTTSIGNNIMVISSDGSISISRSNDSRNMVTISSSNDIEI